MRSILVLRGGALGDFLLTLPLLRAIRAEYPTARIELVGNAAAAQLAVDALIIDAAHSQNEARWAGLYASETLPPMLARWLAEFDLVILGWPDPEGDVARHFPVRPGQVFRSIDPTPRGGPIWRQWLEDAAPLLSDGKTYPTPFTPLPLSIDAAAEADRRILLSRPYAAIHPGSGSAAKTASADLWWEVVRRLAPLPVLVVIGEAEAPLADHARSLAPSRVQIAERWPLPILAAALARAAAYAGHDTGVSHLAAAVGTPTHVVFGPTDPAVWSPFGGVVYLSRHDTKRTAFDPGVLALALRGRIAS